LPVSRKNSSYLRKLNKETVLNVIRTQKVSRAEIARFTGLTRPTVSAIVENLLKSGYIEETGIQEIKRGRYPEILSIRPDFHYAIGINISRDKSLYGLFDIFII
jgi:DNA-binding Lrp family transcriptional regulator